ncbi:MAG TPA: HAD family hydrolase [Candidatus Methanofastidiosa archaeon]|nr:HAD family hydrolase [Candidatus Methanofastidiosa archaeon]
MKAIIFDKSGTIFDTCRVALDLSRDEMSVGVSSTRIVDSMNRGALLILEKSKSDLIFSSLDEQDFSSFCRQSGLSLKCVYSSNCDRDIRVDVALDRCSMIPMSKFKQTLNALFDEIGGERMNCGVIYDVANERPSGVLSTGGRLLEGVMELFDHLRDEGWDIYIATGDTLEGMRELSGKLGLPCKRIFCFQDETKKAESVRKLKETYETVVMVGNDSNDLMAFKEADISILVLQDGLEKRKELFDVATHVVDKVGDIRNIL